MENIPGDFNEVRNKGEELYKTFADTYCPYFKDRVVFNYLGLAHLKFKQREKSRAEADQYMRFKLLHLAPVIIRASSTLQGSWETHQFEPVEMGNRVEHVLKRATYYEFIALIKRDRVKIILKQVENGHKMFWSIIPFWEMNSETRSRIFHEGSPDTD